MILLGTLAVMASIILWAIKIGMSITPPADIAKQQTLFAKFRLIPATRVRK
jgi:hypothetical protein